MSQLAPSGWYTDETNPELQRWWTGTAWTSATAPGPANRQSPLRFEHLKPEVDKERRRARWAIGGVILSVLMYAVGLLYLLPKLNEQEAMLNQLEPNSAQWNDTASAMFMPALSVLVVMLIAVVTSVITVMWLMQSAKTAGELGIKQRISHGWAFAWFIPLVMLVVPYLMVQDLYAKRSAGRILATTLWVVVISEVVLELVVGHRMMWGIGIKATPVSILFLYILIRAVLWLSVIVSARKHHEALLDGYLSGTTTPVPATTEVSHYPAPLAHTAVGHPVSGVPQ